MEFSSNKYSVQWTLIFFSRDMHAWRVAAVQYSYLGRLKGYSESDMKMCQTVLLKKISKNTFRKGIFFPFKSFFLFTTYDLKFEEKKAS
jgi:hypothetical protein